MRLSLILLSVGIYFASDSSDGGGHEIFDANDLLLREFVDAVDARDFLSLKNLKDSMPNDNWDTLVSKFRFEIQDGRLRMDRQPLKERYRYCRNRLRTLKLNDANSDLRSSQATTGKRARTISFEDEQKLQEVEDVVCDFFAGIEENHD
jgi:hypothetical protein